MVSVIDFTELNVTICSGFLVDPTSPEAIAEKIILILKDQALSRRLGKRGRERVVEEFRWQDIATKLETELSQLIQAQEN